MVRNQHYFTTLLHTIRATFLGAFFSPLLPTIDLESKISENDRTKMNTKLTC